MIATAFVSCSKEDPDITIPERVDIVLTKSEAEVLEAGTDFSFDLFREVASRNGYGNIFISPLSAHIATCMLANGAEGETYSQIVKTLGYEGFSINDVNSAYSTLVSGLRKVDTSTKLEIANALWVNKIFPVSKTFADGMAKNYDANVKNLDFGSRDAVKTINKWCSDKTDGKIPQMLTYLNPETKLMLINALLFKAPWRLTWEILKNREFTTAGGWRLWRFRAGPGGLRQRRLYDGYHPAQGGKNPWRGPFRADGGRHRLRTGNFGCDIVPPEMVDVLLDG